MQQGLLGRKVGVTQIFDDMGNRVCVTVVQAGPCVVVKKKLASGPDGYNALVLGFDAAEPQPAEKDRLIRPSRRWLNKPQTFFFKKAFGEGKEKYFKELREFRLPEQLVEMADVGDEIKADLFAVGDYIDATATSKGRGFAGGMRRHNWKGAQTQTHGTHEYFRHGGAVSSNTYPGRLFAGRRMPGQMGNERVTVENLKIVGVDTVQNLLFIQGAVPGAANGVVVVKRAKKKIKKA